MRIPKVIDFADYRGWPPRLCGGLGKPAACPGQRFNFAPPLTAVRGAQGDESNLNAGLHGYWAWPAKLYRIRLEKTIHKKRSTKTAKARTPTKSQTIRISFMTCTPTPPTGFLEAARDVPAVDRRPDWRG